ncbi:MAG: MerR family transcriptional regulator [Hyphomicrobiales bacterium]|nr:MerR family transcriptional regulator [Hyphomicrobiales bacterium]MCY4033286.1 MerR family transcriptional regulator [Hyphomicrobiales bacterium]
MALKPRPRTSGVSYATLKSPEAFRSISEASGLLGVPQHVLRFWESKFTQLRPLKRRGGRRYYRLSDIELLFGIHKLLYTDRYTIEGVQKVFAQQGTYFVVNIGKRALEDSKGNAGTNKNLSIVSNSTPRESLGEAARAAPIPAPSPEQLANISEDVRRKVLDALDELDEIANSMQAKK